MSNVLFQRIDADVNFLVSAVDQGTLGLPDLQRPFVWSTSKVRDLFDSMYRGYPVGYLMLWANPVAPGTAKQIGTEGHGQTVPATLIIDGQQRLTSLYAAMKGRPVLDKNFQERPITIAFHPLREAFDVANAAIRKSPEWIGDISTVFANDADAYTLVSEYLDKLGEAREVSTDERKQASQAIGRLLALKGYPFSALQINADADEEAVAEIFVRVNSRGQKLKQSDFILTLLSVSWPEGRTALESFARAAKRPSADGAPSPFNHHIQPQPDQLLRAAIAVGLWRARLKAAYQFLRGKGADGSVTLEERARNTDRLRAGQARVLDLTRWHEFMKALVAAGFRSGAQVSSGTSIVYAYVFYLIGRDEYGVDPVRLRQLIGRFFFMAALTSRYSSSSETTMEEDLARLRDIDDADGFVAALDRMIDSTLTGDFWRINLPDSLETSSTNAAALGAYHAAQNLLGSRVLFSTVKVSELMDPALKAPRASLERHHLFPKAYLKRQGITGTRDTNQIANYALVEWTDNGAIADRPPAEYVPKMEARFSPDEVEAFYQDHGLAPGWYEMAYGDFLKDRRQRIAEVTRRGFSTLARAAEAAPSGPAMTLGLEA